MDGNVVERWRAGRARCLFQYLLVNRNRIVPKDRLREVLWPHATWSSESSSLKVAVHALRQVLASQKGFSGQRLEVIYQDFGYLLRVDNDVWIDFCEFESAVDRARVAELRGDVAGAVEAYDRAVALYRGDFLIGETADWVTEQREWLRGAALRARSCLAEYELVRGNDGQALHHCRASLEIDPCREEIYEIVMLIHAGRGELIQVRRWYELCVQRLRTLLDASPSPALTRLLDDAQCGRYRGEKELSARLGGGDGLAWSRD
ncbi:MAG: winged helix-turn-helix domain-containing protein [Actinobacteria bacterium]|nr:winged helix-turn-helix domain-containing protein [Actinomycetota bacterium]